MTSARCSWWIPTAEATGRLVFEAISALGGPVTESVANRLFAALATDTGWFRHSNTTPPTFALAEQLQRAGASQLVSTSTCTSRIRLPRLKLKGLWLARATGRREWPGRVLRKSTVGDYEATGAVPQDTEDLINDTSVSKASRSACSSWSSHAAG